MKISQMVGALIGVIAISGCNSPKPHRKYSSSEILSSSIKTSGVTSVSSVTTALTSESSITTSPILTSSSSLTSATSLTSVTPPPTTSITSQPTTSATSRPTTSITSQSTTSATSRPTTSITSQPTTSATSRPTTTTIRPTTSSSSGISPVDDYYATISESMSGNTLKRALYEIIRGHTKIAYGSLADCFTITDRNWNLSPNEGDANPKMNLIYLVDNAGNPHTRSEYTKVWDKEHIWAKSNGFNSEGCMAYSDMHHLRASDKSNNNQRSSLPFAEASTGGKYILDYNDDPSGYVVTNKSYTPLPEYRGDVARALFYMATRYGESEAKSKGEVKEVLQLTRGTDKSGGAWGYLDTLLKWNEDDPVDAFEINRNNLIYERYQHNRNPYIDHPEWARKVFGN